MSRLLSRPLATATALALGTAAISGVSNFLNKIAVSTVKDPIVYTTLKNVLVAALVVGLVLGLSKWREVAALDRAGKVRLLLIGAVGGSLPFALFFTGLTKTSALNAALIHKTLFVWVALLALPFLKERLTRGQWLGAAAIFGANLVIGGFKGFSFGAGELMILAATLLWAVENVIAKRALADVSSVTVAAARMAIGSAILAPFALARGGAAAVAALGPEQWMWVLIASALLTGYVLTWYTALKHAPATYVATLLLPATLVTNVLSAIFITHSFAGAQIASAALFVAGIAIFVRFANSSSFRHAASPA